MLPSACSPHVVFAPSEISMKAPAGGSLSLRLLAPQHTALPSVRSAQLWSSPLESQAKEPSGGKAASELTLSPQHVMLPSAPSPQEKFPPAETWVNVQDGGVACPSKLPPQQLTLP